MSNYVEITHSSFFQRFTSAKKYAITNYQVIIIDNLCMCEGQPISQSEDGLISREWFFCAGILFLKLVPKVPLGVILNFSVDSIQYPNHPRQKLRDAVGNTHCYMEKEKSADKPARAHLRSLNIILMWT